MQQNKCKEGIFLSLTDAEGGERIQRACHQRRGEFQLVSRLTPGVFPE